MKLNIHIFLYILHVIYKTCYLHNMQFRNKTLNAMQHLKRGTVQKLMSHFITMIMVNVSHVICCFIDCFLKQVFRKTWVLSIKGWLQPNGTYLNINKGHGLALTNIIVMKWDTCSFRIVPLFDVLHPKWNFQNVLQLLISPLLQCTWLA